MSAKYESAGVWAVRFLDTGSVYVPPNDYNKEGIDKYRLNATRPTETVELFCRVPEDDKYSGIMGRLQSIGLFPEKGPSA